MGQAVSDSGKKEIDNEVFIMDGGMGHQLRLLGLKMGTNIWSATALVEDDKHHLVVEAHKLYLSAGAQSITTSNYAVQPNYFTLEYGNDFDWSLISKYATLAGKLASQARDESGRKDAIIYGCLPPIAESHRPDLANEYIRENPDKGQQFYYDTAKGLQPYVDVFLCETMNSHEELMCALNAIRGFGLPIAVSMDGKFRDPQTFKARPEEAERVAQTLLNLIDEGVQVELLAFNCAISENIFKCLNAIKPETKRSLRAHGVKLGAYPNTCHPVVDATRVYSVNQSSNSNGDLYPEAIKRDETARPKFIQTSEQFIHLGCNAIGGCCGFGAEDIARLSKYFHPNRAIGFIDAGGL